MKLLVIGSGGREHAIAWKLARSPRVSKIYVAPGNGGTALEDGLENVALQCNTAADIPALLEFAKKEAIALTIVGPEAPLAAGIVDVFAAAGLKIFGPTQAAARLESSKDFSKAFMQRHAIPTAAYASFSDAEAAHRYVDQQGAPIVIKADGLAAGKGVVVALSLAEAHAAIDAMLIDNKMAQVGNEAGALVVIEEFLEGEEVSFIVMADGRNVLPLATSQDHKRLNDGDLGPNTGGMGAYSPAPTSLMTPMLTAKVMREVIWPVMRGMEKEGDRYSGFLYAGLMIGKDASGKDTIKVLEFNCRLGDPETQPIMLRLKSDLFALFEHAINGTLDKVEAEWDRRAALGVVMAAANYPNAPRKGDVISSLPKFDTLTAETDYKVFHAGTAQRGSNVVTAGGRVLCVTALGDTVKIAQHRAYEIADTIHFDGCQMRRDIGYRAVNRATGKK